MNPRALAAVGLLMSLAIPASAQPAARAQELAERSRAASAEGRIEEAYGLARAAAEGSERADLWLQVAELADRLRLDRIALHAYEMYLQRAGADADDRAAIEGRVRVLQHLIRGGGYALSEDERAVTLIDWSSVQPPTNSALVDWQGRPQVRRPSPSQLALAAWDGAVRPRDPSLIPAEHVLGPSEPTGLGRALATP